MRFNAHYLFRTGYGHPEAFTFEDLGSPAAKLSGEGTSTIDTLKRPRRDGTATRVHRKASGLFRGTGKKVCLFSFYLEACLRFYYVTIIILP